MVLNPDDRPFKKLADEISRRPSTLLEGCDSAELADRLLECCQGDIEGAIEGVQKWLITPALAGAPIEAQLILVVDQAEELWTRAADQRKPFLLFLVALVHNPHMRVLSTLRSDLYKDLTEFELIAKLFNDQKGHFHILSAPNPATLAEMIEGPLRVADIQRDDDLIGAILDDAKKIGGDALPLVAHTLSVMVADAQGGRLTLDAYRKIGRLQGAVQTALERAGRILPGQLPPLFDLLYEIRAGAPVRRLVSRGELAELNVDISAAINRLVKARILVAGVSDDGSHSKKKTIDNVQLAHDALFEVWPELRDWIKQHRRDLEIRDELLRDAERWEFRGRRSRHIRLRPEALNEIATLNLEKPYLFRRNPVVGRYLEAADELRLRELLISYLKGRHLGAALDTYLEGGRLTKDDRGMEPSQLIAAFHAAVTGDDRVDEAFLARGGPVGFNSGPSVYDIKENVNKELSGGLVPLEVASMFGHVHLVRKLVERGANPNRRSSESGSTALGLAAYGGQLDIVRYFIEECHINADLRDEDNASSLIWALNRGHEHVVSYLLEHSAQFDVRMKDAKGEKEAFNALTEAVRGGNLALVRKVMEQLGFDANLESEIGATPLCVACQKVKPKYLAVAEFLLEKGANIDGAKLGWRPLTLATAAGFAEMMRFLLDRGANPNVGDQVDDTPLHCAAVHASSKPTQLLLEYKADPNKINLNGLTPLTIAASNGRDETVELLLASGADPELTGKGAWTALQYAAADGDVAIVHLLLDKGAKTETTTSDGWTPLSLAAAYGNVEATSLLLQHGADPNFQNLATGMTALHVAVARKQGVVAAFLLDHGAEITATRKDGLQPLHVAVLMGGEAVVRLLLDRGVDVSTRGKGGLTALHLAAANGIGTLTQLLLERGADPGMRSRFGSTPEQLAANGKHETIVKMLAEAVTTEDLEKDEEIVFDEQFVPVSSAETVAEAAGDLHEPDEAEARQVLEDAKKLLEPFDLSERSAIRMAELPFYKNFRLVIVTDENLTAPNRIRLLWKKGTAKLLDWKNSGIYETNESAPIELTPSTVTAYVKFFFGNVRGPLGKFAIVEDGEEIAWTDETTTEEKARVAKLLKPVTLRGLDEDGRYIVTATLIFKNALFRSNVRSAPHAMSILNVRRGILENLSIGQVDLTDEELLLEDLNVRVDPAATNPLG